MPSTPAAPPPAGLRPRKTRRKTGCIHCRIRKRKCDEEKPSCAACQKNGLLCSWVPEDEFAWRKRMELPGRQNTPSWSPSRMTEQSSSHSPVLSSASSSASSSSSSWALEVDSSLLTQLCPSLQLSGAWATDVATQSILRRFIERTSPKLVLAPVSPGTTDPIHIALQMASSDNLIMHAILAVGGFSAPTPDTEHDRRLEERSLNHYGIALRELKHAITAFSMASPVTELTEKDALRLLLATYLLTAHEVRSFIDSA